MFDNYIHGFIFCIWLYFCMIIFIFIFSKPASRYHRVIFFLEIPT